MLFVRIVEARIGKYFDPTRQRMLKFSGVPIGVGYARMHRQRYNSHNFRAMRLRVGRCSRKIMDQIEGAARQDNTSPPKTLDLAIVVLNYNTRDLLRECLR